MTKFTACDYSSMIARKEISCGELMQTYLQQIKTYNPKVNAIVSKLPDDMILAQAKQMDQALSEGKYYGFLHGLPLAPKDLTATKGLPTTLGSPILKDQTQLPDSIVVERMRKNGAVFIGKTNVPEFGLGSHTYNPLFGITRNAYDLSKSAGGSSGGAAVSLALHMLPVADGSDFGGSLRNPAAWNNVYGLRPSPGRVPSQAPDTFYDQFSTEGPMARNVPDLAMLLAVQSGYDQRAPLSLKEDSAVFTKNLDIPVTGKKIAWLGDFNHYLPMEEGLLDALESALRYFVDLQVEVIPAQVNYSMENLWQCWLTLRAFIASGKLSILYQKPANRPFMKPEALWEIEQGQSLLASDIYAASVARTSWYRAVMQLFENYDYLLLPATQLNPFPAEWDWPKSIAGKSMDTYHRWMEVVIGPTLAGLPVLAIPAGLHQGLPMGYQLIGKPRGEWELLTLGYAWQRATPFGNMTPSLLER